MKMKMKKKITASTAVAGLMAVSFAIGAYAASDIKLFINGKQIDTPVEIVDGSSYVPLRVVSESLGAEVKWDGDARTISITGGAQAAAPVKSDVKTFDVNVIVESGPMKMKITKVSLDPAYKKGQYYDAVKAIVMDVEVENTTDATVNWYPTHGKLALNTKEQIDRGSFQSDQVGGEFIGKIVKTGKIAFEVKGDLEAITSMNYVVDGAMNGETYALVGQDKTVEIILK